MENSYFLFGTGNSPMLSSKDYETKLRDKGLVRKNNPFFAKMIICRNIEIAKKACLLFPFKKIVIYQVELYVDTIKTEFYYLYKIKRTYVINGFNGGAFFNN